MSLPDILPLEDFADLLPVKTFAWKLIDQQGISGLAGGDIIVEDLAPKYWEGDVVLDSMNHDKAGEIAALIDSFDGALRRFYWCDPRSPYPQYDPTGEILGSRTVRILDINSNNKQIKLKNLYEGYKIKRRDFFAFDFGADPIHRALHRVVSVSDTADGDGNTEWIEFRPHLLADPPLNTVVTLIRPAAECLIVPKTFNEGRSEGTRNYGMSFKIRQRL